MKNLLDEKNVKKDIKKYLEDSESTEKYNDEDFPVY